MLRARRLSLDHRQIQRKKFLILPDGMLVVSGDALGEHGDRGVSRSVHNDLLSGPQSMPRITLLQ